MGLKLLPVVTYRVLVLASKVGVLQTSAPVAPSLSSAGVTMSVCQSTGPSDASASTTEPLPPLAWFWQGQPLAVTSPRADRR